VPAAYALAWPLGLPSRRGLERAGNLALLRDIGGIECVCAGKKCYQRAEKHGVLKAADPFLRNLEEEDWYHVGE
jgi:hypothetical protein